LGRPSRLWLDFGVASNGEAAIAFNARTGASHIFRRGGYFSAV
jgi:hypothetical protein